jgi:hypothetical protein
MNFVNLSTSFKKIIELSGQIEPDNENSSTLSSLKSQLIVATISKFESEKVEKSNARAIANIFFYYNRLSGESIDSVLNSILIKFILPEIESMNEQETANIVYTLAKMKAKEQLITLEPKISQKINGYSPRAVSLIFYCYSSLTITLPDFYRTLDDIILKFDPNRLNELDLVHLILSYSKIKASSSSTRFLNKINQDKGQLLFEKLGILGISAVLISLTKFDEPILNKEVYDNLESKILDNKNSLNGWKLANILRGYDHFNFGSERFFQQLEPICIKKCSSFNNQDFTTILHVYARNLNGSYLFYETFDRIFIQNKSEQELNDESKPSKKYIFMEEENQSVVNLKKNRNQLDSKEFSFLFYSFNHVKDGYKCSDSLKIYLKNYIEENISNFKMEELGPIFAMYVPFFNEKGLVFEKLVNTILEKSHNEKCFRIEIKPLKEVIRTLFINTNVFQTNKDITNLIKNQVLLRAKEICLDLKKPDIEKQKGFIDKVNMMEYIVNKFSKIEPAEEIHDILQTWQEIKETFIRKHPDLYKNYSNNFQFIKLLPEDY